MRELFDQLKDAFKHNNLKEFTTIANGIPFSSCQFKEYEFGRYSVDLLELMKAMEHMINYKEYARVYYNAVVANLSSNPDTDVHLLIMVEYIQKPDLLVILVGDDRDFPQNCLHQLKSPLISPENYTHVPKLLAETFPPVSLKTVDGYITFCKMHNYGGLLRLQEYKVALQCFAPRVHVYVPPHHTLDARLIVSQPHLNAMLRHVGGHGYIRDPPAAGASESFAQKYAEPEALFRKYVDLLTQQTTAHDIAHMCSYKHLNAYLEGDENIPLTVEEWVLVNYYVAEKFEDNFLDHVGQLQSTQVTVEKITRSTQKPKADIQQALVLWTALPIAPILMEGTNDVTKLPTPKVPSEYDVLLHLLLGPEHPDIATALNDLMDEDEPQKTVLANPCSVFLHRMYMCTCTTDGDNNEDPPMLTDEWFRGSCQECQKKILSSCDAVRFPGLNGLWYGCYCSWTCSQKAIEVHHRDLMTLPDDTKPFKDGALMTDAEIEQRDYYNAKFPDDILEKNLAFHSLFSQRIGLGIPLRTMVDPDIPDDLLPSTHVEEPVSSETLHQTQFYEFVRNLNKLPPGF